MSSTLGLDELKQLNIMLTGLLEDPHPGLITWRLRLQAILVAMAKFSRDERILKALET